MPKNIYVGNLPPSTTESQVCALFSEFGVVDGVRLVTAAGTGRSRGAGYVAMSTGAGAAIEALDRRPMAGRELRVRCVVSRERLIPARFLAGAALPAAGGRRGRRNDCGGGRAWTHPAVDRPR